MGGTTPDLPPVDETPHLSPFHQSPDAHVTSRGFQSIKATVWRGKIQIVSSVMADDLFLSFTSPSNLLVDAAAGAMLWSGRNSMRNCVN